jgi:hypothetical protein
MQQGMGRLRYVGVALVLEWDMEGVGIMLYPPRALGLAELPSLASARV